MENKMQDSKREKLKEKLYSLIAPLKPSQFAIEMGAKSDEQIIEEILEEVDSEISKAKEETLKAVLEKMKESHELAINDEGYFTLRTGIEIVESELDKLSPTTSNGKEK